MIAPTRRAVLRGGLGVAAALVAGCATEQTPTPAPPSPGPAPGPDPGPALAELERRQGRRVALVALDTGSGRGNTAANLLTDLLGGPAATTAFVRTLGDGVTRLDRLEPALNETAPGDERDTSTPDAMAADLRALVLGDALDPGGRAMLTDWMVGATTGARQIRAGTPAGWRVGDKTGSGAQGENHDVAVAWPPGRAPLVLAVYTTPSDPASTNGRATVAEATRIAVGALPA